MGDYRIIKLLLLLLNMTLIFTTHSRIFWKSLDRDLDRNLIISSYSVLCSSFMYWRLVRRLPPSAQKWIEMEEEKKDNLYTLGHTGNSKVKIRIVAINSNIYALVREVAQHPRGQLGCESVVRKFYQNSRLTKSLLFIINK